MYECNLHKPSNILINKAYDLLLLELYKYINKDNVVYNTFIDLENDIIRQEVPKSASIMLINDIEFNEWTKLSYCFDKTVCCFKKFYEDIFKINISMIANGSAIIYAEFMEENLNKTLGELNLNNETLTIMPDNDTIIPDICISF